MTQAEGAGDGIRVRVVMGQDQDRLLFAKHGEQAVQTLPRIQGGEVAPICARPIPSGLLATGPTDRSAV
jgi:hypothetical protein